MSLSPGAGSMAFWQKSGSRRRIGVIGVVFVLAAVAAGVWWLDGSKPSAAARKAAQPLPVTATTAIRQDVPEIYDTIGTVQSIDPIAIQSQVNGPIVKIEFQPGQEVKKGQELFLIDPRPYQAALDQQQAQLAHDKAVLGEAQMDLKRYQGLEKENSISKQQSEDQGYVVQQDQGTVEVDEANVATAKINLDYCHIKSPIDGRAGVLLVELGNLVGPSAGSQATSSSATSTTSLTSAGGAQKSTGGGLVTVSQMKPIYVNFPVPQTMFNDVSRRQAVAALEVDAYTQSGKLIQKGKLTVIDNQVNTATGTVAVQATFANSDKSLWPGQFVQVALVTAIRRDAVTVPQEAVMMGPTGAYVYLIGADNKAHRVDVTISSRRKGVDVVEKGLSAGDKVVTDGQYRLSNGASVQVRQTTAKTMAQQ